MKNILLVAGGIVLLVVGFYFYQNQSDNDSVKVEVLGEPTVTIVRTNEGYVPNEVTLKKGDIVLWTNESNDYHWPASDLHPTHGVYPEFDPLRAIGPGEEWKFRFDEVGEWKFHDHLRANVIGTVTVTQ